MFFILLKREFRLLYKKKIELLQLLVFILLGLLIFPLAAGPERALLASAGRGYMWIIQLFMIFLSGKLFYEEDYRDGSLEQLFLQIPALEMLIIAKYIAYSLNLILISLISLPFLGLLFGIEAGTIMKTAASLIIGIPCLAAIAGFGASLTLGSRKAGLITPIILTPLYIPVLIFSVGSDNFLNDTVILTALFLLIAPLSIFFSALALKIAMRE